jgi:hypothetical protein
MGALIVVVSHLIIIFSPASIGFTGFGVSYTTLATCLRMEVHSTLLARNNQKAFFQIQPW